MARHRRSRYRRSPAEWQGEHRNGVIPLLPSVGMRGPVLGNQRRHSERRSQQLQFPMNPEKIALEQRTQAITMATTVLIVDDEKDLVDLVRYHLAKEGSQCPQASDRLTALRLTHQPRPPPPP